MSCLFDEEMTHGKKDLEDESEEKREDTENVSTSCQFRNPPHSTRYVSEVLWNPPSMVRLSHDHNFMMIPEIISQMVSTLKHEK